MTRDTRPDALHPVGGEYSMRDASAGWTVREVRIVSRADWMDVERDPYPATIWRYMGDVPGDRVRIERR